MSLAESLNKFTFKLYNAMTHGKNENFFISPFSISSALSMCLVGARGDTAAQLKSLLALDNLKDEQINQLNEQLFKRLNSMGNDVALDVANKIYTQQGYDIKKDFNDSLKKHFSSEAQLVNFAESENARQSINSWVADKTKNKIVDLIQPGILNALTRLVLVNAIYFKGKWLNQFDKAHTQKEAFHLRDNSTKQVDMMRLLNKKFKLQVNPGNVTALVCEFPYVGESVAMTIVLPHEGIHLEAVEAQLNDAVLRTLLKAEGVRNNKVHVYIPKFKLDFKEELSTHLKGLGASLPFDEVNADFTGINDKARQEGLHISKVIHNAVVEVNEEGTEAAAATAAVMMVRCAMVTEPPPEEFKCNRPFLFIIHEKETNTILFMGKYMKPTN